MNSRDILHIVKENYDDGSPTSECLVGLSKEVDIKDLALFIQTAPRTGWNIWRMYQNRLDSGKAPDPYTFTDFAKDIIANAKDEMH